MQLRFQQDLYVKYAICQLPLEKLQSFNLFLGKAKKFEPSNCRPISLLLLFSKVLERVIQDKTNAFLKESDLLYNYQSGFRTNNSTNLCLLFLTDKTLKSSDERLLTGIILTDLQKAFDIINHEILFKKPKAMGFYACIAWFQSYFSKRIFFLSIENQLSDYGRMSCGIPKGLILVPLLFLIWVSDMPQAVNPNLFLYADDSCLSSSIKTLKKLKRY